MFKRLRARLYIAEETERRLRSKIEMLEARIASYEQSDLDRRVKDRVAKFEKDLAEHGTAYIEYRLYQSHYRDNAKPQFVVRQADYDEKQFKVFYAFDTREEAEQAMAELLKS